MEVTFLNSQDGDQIEFAHEGTSTLIRKSFSQKKKGREEQGNKGKKEEKTIDWHCNKLINNLIKNT